MQKVDAQKTTHKKQIQKYAKDANVQICKKFEKQAGAELCQAQVKLRVTSQFI